MCFLGYITKNISLLLLANPNGIQGNNMKRKTLGNLHLTCFTKLFSWEYSWWVIAITNGLLHKSSDDKIINHPLKIGWGEKGKYQQDFMELIGLTWCHCVNSRFTLISLQLHYQIHLPYGYAMGPRNLFEIRNQTITVQFPPQMCLILFQILNVIFSVFGLTFFSCDFWRRILNAGLILYLHCYRIRMSCIIPSHSTMHSKLVLA